MSLRDDILFDARADDIPIGESGLWNVRKFATDKEVCNTEHGKWVSVPPGHYTQLWRWTDSTLHLLGELVMQDTPQELNTHLNFMMRAHGRVLITGLGLGCVLRGCLANPRVNHCTVIERDPAVLRLVKPYLLPNDRYIILQADAVEWCKAYGGRFDCCWHDLWTDEDRGEPHLQLIHAQLISAMGKKCGFQGAWNMPRPYRRLFKIANVI